MQTPTPHTILLHTTSPAPSYTVHHWRCMCGAESARTLRSRLRAELDWWSEHVMPEAVPPRHTPTLDKGRGFSESLVWECSCRAIGPLHGHQDARRAYQSHRAHVNHALQEWYERERLRQIYALPEAQFVQFRRDEANQRMEYEEQERRSRHWRQQAIRMGADIRDDQVWADLDTLI